MSDKALLESIGYVSEELRIANLRLLEIGASLHGMMGVARPHSIKTVTVANDEVGFDEKVNALLDAGWRIQSTNCSALGGDTHIDEIFQAILAREKD